MNPHTPDQVVAMKNFVDSQPSVDRKTYSLNELEVTYTTVDMGDAKPFDYAVAAFVAPRDDGEPVTEADYEIAVSNDVPEELRGMWAWHELHDFGVLGHEADNRCLQTEQVLAEAMSTDPSLYKSYLSVRIPFYEGLADFITKDINEKDYTSAYSLDDLNGCHYSLRFLEKQIYTTQANRKANRKNQELARYSLLDLVETKRSEIEQAKLIALKKAEKVANHKAEIVRASDANAAEFIKIMREKNIKPIKVYAILQTIVSCRSDGPDEYESTFTTYDIVVDAFGEGWTIRSSDRYDFLKNYVLMSNGKSYRANTGDPTDKPKIPGRHDTYRNRKGPILEKDSVWVNPEMEIKSPYTEEDKKILVDTIIRLEGEQDTSKKSGVNSTAN